MINHFNRHSVKKLRALLKLLKPDLYGIRKKHKESFGPSKQITVCTFNSINKIGIFLSLGLSA